MTAIFQTDSATFEFDEEDVPFIILRFLETGRGSVTCLSCNATNQTSELIQFSVGHGSSPFAVNLKQRGGIKRLFQKKQRLPGLFGGRGFQCPGCRNTLIEVITWMT